MALNIENIVAELKEATILELNDLVKAIEEEFGVTAAAPVAVSGLPEPAHTRYPIPTHDPKGNQGTYEETSSPKRR